MHLLVKIYLCIQYNLLSANKARFTRNIPHRELNFSTQTFLTRAFARTKWPPWLSQLCVCVCVCVWRPIDEIKQFLGLLENYYKRIIKRGAKVESKQRRCQNNKCQCPRCPLPSLRPAPPTPLPVRQTICKPPLLSCHSPLPCTCMNLHVLVTPAPGWDRHQSLPGLAWPGPPLAFQSHTQTHIKRVRQTRLYSPNTRVWARESEREAQEPLNKFPNV